MLYFSWFFCLDKFHAHPEVLFDPKNQGSFLNFEIWVFAYWWLNLSATGSSLYSTSFLGVHKVTLSLNPPEIEYSVFVYRNRESTLLLCLFYYLSLLRLFCGYINRQSAGCNPKTSLGPSASFFTMAQQSSVPTSSDPPPFDPTEPSTPVAFPIKTLEDLESGAYFKSFHYPFNRSTVALQPAPLPDRRRMLVCHDMAGGYLDDKWIQGGTNPDAFALWHWYLIDIFVYFSHDLVTLPPPCWTNTAHRHGVKVLDQFTDWFYWSQLLCVWTSLPWFACNFFL